MIFDTMYGLFLRYIQPILTTSGIAIDGDGYLFEAGKPQVKFFNNDRPLIVVNSDQMYRKLIEQGEEFEVFSPFTNLPHSALLCRFMLSRLDGEFNSNPIAEMFQSWELEDDSVNIVEFGFTDNKEDGLRHYFFKNTETDQIIAEGFHEDQPIGMWLLCVNSLRSLGEMELNDDQLESILLEILEACEMFKADFRRLKTETALMDNIDFAAEDFLTQEYGSDAYLEERSEEGTFDPADYFEIEDEEVVIPPSDYSDINEQLAEDSLEFDMSPLERIRFNNMTGR